MKKVMCTIWFLMLVGGCEALVSAIDAPYHEYTWYQEGKSISQARRDCNECIYEVNKTTYPSSTLFQQCMGLRGYQLYKATDLAAKQIEIQKVKGWNAYWMYNDVAGTSCQN